MAITNRTKNSVTITNRTKPTSSVAGELLFPLFGLIWQQSGASSSYVTITNRSKNSA
mgnify:FL=1